MGRFVEANHWLIDVLKDDDGDDEEEEEDDDDDDDDDDKNLSFDKTHGRWFLDLWNRLLDI